MRAVEKVRTLRWFLERPRYWAHAAALASRKVRPDRDRADLRSAATQWAAGRAVSLHEALATVGLLERGDSKVPTLDPVLLDEARARADAASVKMGGPTDLDLLYAAARLCDATSAVETGVAYGWSSLAILAALEERGGRLASVDMPYPRLNNEGDVGIVVPERMRERWILVREPDRYGLDRAIERLGGRVGLCHYDSDKSWYGRRFGYPRMWRALAPGGVFISDDIQDNLYFREFVEALGLPFAVTESQGKFVGILRKPA